MPSYAFNEDRMMEGIRAFYAERRAAVKGLIRPGIRALPAAAAAPVAAPDPTLRIPPRPDHLTRTLGFMATPTRLNELRAHLVALEDLAAEIRVAIEAGEAVTLRRSGLPFNQTLQTIAAVSAELGISREQLLYARGRRLFQVNRYLLIALLRRQGNSHPCIGRLLNMHHTSVMHAVDRSEYLRRTDNAFAASFDKLCTILEAGTLQQSEAA